MNYKLLTDLLQRVQTFEQQQPTGRYSADIAGFESWVCEQQTICDIQPEPLEWEGRQNGRTADSVINTLFVHLNRYARTYAKAAIQDSEFSTPDEFIYLITLNAFGPMSKMQLIRRNVQEKSVGIQIINRLIRHGWVLQADSAQDKRSKVLSISTKGSEALNGHMDKIRIASTAVTGNLDQNEKIKLIRLLMKLDTFHKQIFIHDTPLADLLQTAMLQQRKSITN